MNTNSIKLGILGSGTGSNMAAIARECASGLIPAEISVVISDVEGAGILDKAETADIPHQYIDPGKFRTKLDEEAEAAYTKALVDAEVDLVVLCGFMRILKGDILRQFEGRVVNIHPSLLPSFPGLDAWKQALDYGVQVTGCTVHFVDQGIDTGPILAQTPVMVEEGDIAASLHSRIHEAEWKLYPATVKKLAERYFETGKFA